VYVHMINVVSRRITSKKRGGGHESHGKGVKENKRNGK
jgi:hypothetical protein